MPPADRTLRRVLSLQNAHPSPHVPHITTTAAFRRTEHTPVGVALPPVPCFAYIPASQKVPEASHEPTWAPCDPPTRPSQTAVRAAGRHSSAISSSIGTLEAAS